MKKLSELSHFQEQQNIVLQGYDPISAGGFTQVPNYLLNNSKLTANTKVVYAKLLSYAWHNNRVYPGQVRMAEEIGSTKSTVNRAIIELEKEGWLEIQRRGQGKTNVYILKFVINKNWGCFPPLGNKFPICEYLVSHLWNSERGYFSLNQ